MLSVGFTYFCKFRGASIKDVYTPGGGGVCQKCTIVDKGEGGGTELCTYTFFKLFITETTQKCSLELWNR